MKEIILCKLGEIVLKGLNRGAFEKLLIKNIKKALEKVGDFDINCKQSTITIIPNDDFFDVDLAISKLQKVFGIVVLSKAALCEKDYNEISKTAKEYLKIPLSLAKTFKVNAKRSDKQFPMNSPQICAEIGGDLLEEFPNLSVDVKNPQVTVTVEIRDKYAFVSCEKFQGAGGMPIGSNGKCALLLSGGIDSPVAGYMIAKRGVSLCCIHFYSYPYTSERAKEKVLDLAKIMTDYCGEMKVFVVPFTKIQEEIKKNCREEMFTLVMRRYMMKIAERIAKSEKASALITGESVGQVASQTLAALAVTDNAVDMPVFRPVIGMDKEEIIQVSKKINTFETSILPYEDCCTVFTPKHPKTKPVLKYVVFEENKLDMENLIQEAVDNVEVITL